MKKRAVILCMLGGSLGFLLCGSLRMRRFYPDDPLWREPTPLAVGKIKQEEVTNSYDFFQNTFARLGEKHQATKTIEARAINTLGEVPDSAWYHNRDTARASLEELARGPGNTEPPLGEARWTIKSAKGEGVTPGFNIQDSKGRKYLLKFDPMEEPELATAADVVGSKFFYALGYNTPENYIVRFTRSQIRVGVDTMFRDAQGRKRHMKEEDVDRLLENVPKDKEGHYRAMASRFISGEIIGPFLYYGVRPDDPNDLVPHEHRRDLRGIYVFAEWLNHTDAKSLNSLDTIVTERNLRYVKHYLIDFGAIMGSDSVDRKSAIGGHEYFIDFKPAVARLVTLGLYAPAWERYRYPHIRGVGNFEAKTFNPEQWKGDYPNPAFDNRLPDDEFWAARKVLAFRDDQIRAMVETGEYSDPRAVPYLTGVLIERRDKIGKAYLSKVLPLDNFEVRDGELAFDDLGVIHNFSEARPYRAQWSIFDNETGQKAPILEASNFAVPACARSASGQYFAVDISADGPPKTMTVYLRSQLSKLDVVGIERRW